MLVRASMVFVSLRHRCVVVVCACELVCARAQQVCGGGVCV